jgi:hypothetical protein
VADALSEIVMDGDDAAPQLASSVPGRAVDTWNGIMIEVVRSGSLRPADRTLLRAAFRRTMQTIDEVPEWYRELPEALRGERDELLAHAIKTAPGERVVAVVGKGHLEGIHRAWDAVAADQASVAHLLSPPPYHAALSVGTPLAASAAVGFAGRALWRHWRAGFWGLAASSGLALGAGVVLTTRMAQVNARVRGAILDRDGPGGGGGGGGGGAAAGKTAGGRW